MKKLLWHVAVFLTLIVPAFASASALVVNNVKDSPFNAVCDGVTDDSAAIAAAFSDSLATGKALYFPGMCKANSQVVWDVGPYRTQGIEIFGCGMRCGLDLRSVSASPALSIKSTATPTADFYFVNWHDMIVWTNTSGVSFQLGQTNFSDPANRIEINRVQVNNYNTSSSLSVCQMNYVAGGHINMICNGNWHGKALELRQSAFVTYEGSYGTADYSVYMNTGFNYGNTFLSPDFENVNVCVESASGTNWNNNFFGGVWSYTGHGIDFQVGRSNKLINPNPNPVSPGTVAGFSNQKVGVTIDSDYVQ